MESKNQKTAICSPYIDWDTSQIWTLTKKMTKCKPKASWHSEAICVFIIWIWSLLPLVGGESSQDIHRQGGEEEDTQGVHVDIRGEGVQEGKKRWSCRSWTNIENRDSKIHPGNGEGKGAGSGRSNGNVCNDKVRFSIPNFSQHSIPISRGGFTAILKKIIP